MSAHQRTAIDATALRLAALLEQYERDVEELTSTPADTALCVRFRRGVDDIRRLCAACPVLSVPWLHVLISHAELVHCLWPGSSAAADTGVAERCKAHHLVAVRAFRQQCLRHLACTERVH